MIDFSKEVVLTLEQDGKRFTRKMTVSSYSVSPDGLGGFAPRPWELRLRSYTLDATMNGLGKSPFSEKEDDLAP